MRGGGGGGGGNTSPESYENNNHLFSNNAFASAILNDDVSEFSGENLRNEIMESIMNHEAAVGGGGGGGGETRPATTTIASGAGQIPSGGVSRQMMSSQSIEMSSSDHHHHHHPGVHGVGRVEDRILHPHPQSHPRSHLLPPRGHHNDYNQHTTIGMDDIGDNYSFRPDPIFATDDPGEGASFAHQAHHQQQAHYPPHLQQQSFNNRNTTGSIATSSMVSSQQLLEQQNQNQRQHIQHFQRPSRRVSFTSAVSGLDGVNKDTNYCNNQINHHISSNTLSQQNPSPHQRRRQSNETETTGDSRISGTTGSSRSRHSIFSSGLSSIKVQISEFDRLILQREKNSDRSLNGGSGKDNYEVPLPQMPHESKDAMIARFIISFVCMVSAILITIFLGRGQFGHASAKFMYHNFILKDNVYQHHHTLNDETTKNGSHLFEKVQTLERAYKRNVLGDPVEHKLSVAIDANGDVLVTVPNHEMVADHYIEFVWIKHVDSNQVVLARNFDPTEHQQGSGEMEAVLKAKVPSNVKLQPYLFCNRHELWVGNEFKA